MFGGAICKCGLDFQFEIRAIWYCPWYFVFDAEARCYPSQKRPFQMVGERRACWVNFSDQTLAEGKTEPGQRPWYSPKFPVPKKKPGEYRLVVEFSKINDATVVHAQPLPRIGDILQRQGKFRIWSVSDMNRGYHQIPNKEEHRNITCMSTPRGTMRWKVLVKGLKNGNAIFK